MTMFKLGFGPMSAEIIDTLVGYSNQQHPIMIIASRNQIDSDNGYVMTTQELNDRVQKSDYLWLCRDHCDSKEEIEKSIKHCLDLYFNNIT